MCQVVYKCTINLTKTSICLLYLRIFTTVKWFRKAVGAIMAFVLLYAVASIIATIFQCSPVSRFWDHSIDGHCINVTRFWYANAAASIFSDFVILFLPMPVVRDLQLPSRQRWGLALVFGLGILYVFASWSFNQSLTSSSVCITSILRMITLDTSSKAPDATYGSLRSTVWTTVEANIGIICACLPMLKAPLATIFPKLFPRGSYREYSDGSDRRPRCPSLPHHTSAAAYNGWGRYIEKKPSQTSVRMSGNTVTGTTPPGKYSSNNSSNPAFCMNGSDVPLGQIAKTTHVNVQYADKKYAAEYSPNDSHHTRSVSNLVSPAISYV